MRMGREGGLEGDINVTPMIDVLLVLLVTFILAQRVRQIVPVNVPPPQPRAGATPAPSIILELRPNHSYAINGTSVERTELASRLTQAFAGRSAKILYIAAGAGWRYGEVVAAADVAKGAGVQVIGYMPPRH